MKVDSTSTKLKTEHISLYRRLLLLLLLLFLAFDIGSPPACRKPKLHGKACEPMHIPKVIAALRRQTLPIAIASFLEYALTCGAQSKALGIPYVFIHPEARVWKQTRNIQRRFAHAPRRIARQAKRIGFMEHALCRLKALLFGPLLLLRHIKHAQHFLNAWESLVTDSIYIVNLCIFRHFCRPKQLARRASPNEHASVDNW
jgi:hypothetical protein